MDAKSNMRMRICKISESSNMSSVRRGIGKRFASCGRNANGKVHEC